MDCGFKTETTLHIIKDCWKARVVWRELGIIESFVDAAFVCPADWLWVCAQNMNPAEFRTVACGCWMLWGSRNKKRHGEEDWGCIDIVLRVRSMLLMCDK
ncbi:hypothetical protein QQ045_006669 [Rhodiola kirilowii]